MTSGTRGQRHKAEWVDFMAHRVARMFAKFKDSVHRPAPGTSFSIYSGYHTPDNAERYGVDWRYVGDLQACDRSPPAGPVCVRRKTCLVRRNLRIPRSRIGTA